jgi:hypothetical protein
LLKPAQKSPEIPGARIATHAFIETEQEEDAELHQEYRNSDCPELLRKEGVQRELEPEEIGEDEGPAKRMASPGSIR